MARRDPSELRGSIVSLVTPFTEDGSFDEPADSGPTPPSSSSPTTSAPPRRAFAGTSGRWRSRSTSPSSEADALAAAAAQEVRAR